MISTETNSFAQRALGAVDLAIEFATLGEYGLEPLPADGPCERRGHRTAWEVLAGTRRGSCAPGRPAGRSVPDRDAA